ncbi:DUF2062 domain-containing protein [Kiloniella sp. b19]|uniref:DUF2062 domain-containing protein n=1 Tax=Kiloniella sp. GXU_MW_B19 TaxID=3141326 RepID=UPI0031DA65D0
MKSWFRHKLHARNKKNWISGFLRLLYYRLIIPILRSIDQPHLVARGVMMGLILGSTPTVGVQLFMILGVWWVSNYILKWKFSLILAMAWSWHSNPFTMIPLYYLFYMTGSVLLFDFDHSQSFDHFEHALGGLQNPDQSFWESLYHGILLLWEKVGVSIFIGCIPYMIILGTLGYWIALRVATKWMHRKQHKMQEKSKTRTAQNNEKLGQHQ